MRGPRQASGKALQFAVLQFATGNIDYQGMICPLLFRSFAVSVALISFAWAGIVEDIRGALDQNNFAAANDELQSYLGQRGVTPEYVEAYSWLARAALTALSTSAAVPDATCAITSSVEGS